MTMTRGLRILPGMLSDLLALATSAPAERGWALWEQSQDPWGALLNVRLGDWPSREACEQERRSREQEPPALRMASYSCLADPVEKPEK